MHHENKVIIIHMTKKKPKTEHKKRGRPTVMTPTVIAKIEELAALDASVEETLFYADISKDSYYDYLKANPEFSERLERLRASPVLKARRTVVEGLATVGTAMTYLEKKRRKEFGNSIDSLTDGQPITSVQVTIVKP